MWPPRCRTGLRSPPLLLEASSSRGGRVSPDHQNTELQTRQLRQRKSTVSRCWGRGQGPSVGRCWLLLRLADAPIAAFTTAWWLPVCASVSASKFPWCGRTPVTPGRGPPSRPRLPWPPAAPYFQMSSLRALEDRISTYFLEGHDPTKTVTVSLSAFPPSPLS